MPIRGRKRKRGAEPEVVEPTEPVVEPVSAEQVSVEPVSAEQVSVEPVSAEQVSVEQVSAEPVPAEPAPSPRYICIDFETNGFSTPGAPRSEWTLPWSNFPTQISVDIVEDGEVSHAYDAVIAGATCLSAWARDNVNLTLPQIRAGTPFREVVRTLATLLRDGDTIVAHNASFDLDTVLARTAQKLRERDGTEFPGIDRVLQAPRFCTMRSAYARGLCVGRKQPKLDLLCRHFQVELTDAHDARADTRALAECVAEAWRRGVMLERSATLTS
jgi:DNA polymerase III alpha subunit (gram-positive type)